MAPWIKNLVMLVATTAWFIYIIVAVLRGQTPDTVVWGVPGAVYFALNPKIPRRNGNGDSKDT